MPLVVGINDLDPSSIDKPSKNTGPGFPGQHHTTFFRSSDGEPDGPTAARKRYPAGKVRESAPHYHEVDQFQIIIEGKGNFGRHHVAPYYVQFTKAYTPYGPLQSDKDTGWAFLLLRTRYDSGGQHFPESIAKLKQIPNRRPWQATRTVTFPAPGSGVSLQDIPEIKDAQGLFAHALTMAPNSRVTAPDPSCGDGQFVVIVKGSLIHDAKERLSLGVVFIKPDEKAYEIQAGSQGLEGFILNFPKLTASVAQAQAPSVANGSGKWHCELCSFAYDEALGMPDEGISPGTRWEDVPQTWSCPDCSASKSGFKMMEI